MAARWANRDVSNVTAFFRTLFLGRTWNKQNRFPDHITPRPYPKPNLPIGPANLASENAYHLRDARRTVQPAREIKKQITDGKEAPKTAGAPPVPGHIYQY